MDDKRLEKSLKLKSLLAENLKQFEELSHEILDNDADKELRGVKIGFLTEIYAKYDELKILNADGDIFFIKDETTDDYGIKKYIGQRILWNLALSKELYIIKRIPNFDSDNEFDYYEYEIEVVD